MHFSAVVFAGLFAVASAQSNTTTLVSSTTAPVSITTTYALTPAQSSQAACLKACASGDVNCQAACIAVPSPDAAAANNTNKCVADCPQGNGTAADNSAYSTCVTDCINKYYYSSSTAATATGNSGGNTKVASTGTGAATATGSGASGSGSGSNGSASQTGSSGDTGNAAGMVRVSGSAIGLLGFIAFFLAM